MLDINQQFSLHHQVAIVTGAAGGLGFELSKILANANAIVVLADTNKKKIDQLVKMLGKKILAIKCDVTKKSDIEKLIEKTHQTFGRIDILINCAGILGADSYMFEVEENDWDDVINVNLKGTWLFSTAVAAYMVKHQIKGRIINISSALGDHAVLKRIHYATSKAGVEHLTRNMAIELVKYGIRVNCLAPGWMLTEMVKNILEGPDGEKWRRLVPMKRAAAPEELIGAVLLLASDASSYMTGAILRVDGGYACHGIESPG